MRCTFDGVEYDGSIYLTGNAHPKVMIDFNKWKSIKGSAIRSEIQDSTSTRAWRSSTIMSRVTRSAGDNESVCWC